MKVDKASVFVDCKKLRRVLQKAQLCMTKADRIIYGTPALQRVGEILGCFILAYDFPEERSYYIRKFLAIFYVLKIDIETMNECGIIKETKDTHRKKSLELTDSGNIVESYSGEKPRTLQREMTELVARIDEGMERWRKFNSKQNQG